MFQMRAVDTAYIMNVPMRAFNNYQNMIGEYLPTIHHVVCTYLGESCVSCHMWSMKYLKRHF